MNKDLPRTFQNKIEKEINNSLKVYTTLDNERTIRKSTINDNTSVEKKIYNIFHSPDYIYKADVTIVTSNNTVKKRIIGKTNNSLITFDNEYIPIANIIDIYK